MNSKAVGERSEVNILARLINLGISVALPYGNNQRYDLILDEGGRLLKAQCKTAVLRKGSVIFRCCSTNGFTGKQKSYHGEIDLFLVYCPANGLVFRVPIEKAFSRRMALRVDPMPKNHMRKDVTWAKDFQM